MAFLFSLQADHIGPHDGLQFSDQLKSNETVIYAGNGAGKTCLSRMFRLCEQSPATTEEANTLLSIGQASGRFRFSITNPNSETTKELDITLCKDCLPRVTNNGYLFHTFNNDYVEDNLKVCSYSPSGEIEGYIVGKGSIDLSDYEENLREIKNEGSMLSASLQESLEDLKTELSDLGISRRMAAYQSLTIDSLKNSPIPKSHSYEKTLAVYNKLQTISEDSPNTAFPNPNFDVSFFDDISNDLEKSFSRANFAEDFLEYIRPNLVFIKSGLKLLENDAEECPFCRQPLDSKTLLLLHEYDAYVADEEAQIIKRLNDHENRCLSLYNKFETWHSRYEVSKARFDSIKPAFEKFSTIELPDMPNVTEVESSINAIIKSIRLKKNDISQSLESKSLYKLKTVFQEIEKAIALAMSTTSQIDTAKDKVNNERLRLRKELCSEGFKRLQISKRETINERARKFELYAEINREYKAKQSTVLSSKRELVASQFGNLIRYFFGDRYKFDEEKFSILFKEESLGVKASRILSEGEKAIVAFCFFLASTPQLLETNEEAEALFFIIDDPISSLDFHYVYMLAQLIRRLHAYSGIGLDLTKRYIIFTHNAEFFNILTRNKIVKNCLTLSNGKLEKMDARIIMPYESHLKDIYEIARKGKHSEHTTGNSIRHVLETVWRFEQPDKANFNEYISSIDEFKGNEFLYSLCQDLSHGAVRCEYPFDEEAIRRACESVICYIDNRFAGQIASIH